MDDPLVSILLPTYNREAYLPEAVDSVFRQTDGRWELIVIDDGSTDGSAAYLDRITDPRVRVHHLPHRGHPEAVRNAAFGLARGRYLAFLDSDDWWEPEKLALQIDALDQNPDSGWSYTSFRVVDAEGRETSSGRQGPLPTGMILEEIVSGGALALTSTVMIRRDLLQQVGTFDESLPVASDIDLWFRLASRCAVAPVSRVLVSRRLHPTHYTVAYRGNREAYEPLFSKLLAQAPTSKIRKLVLARRTKWLVSVADRRRAEGRYREARNALRAAGAVGTLSVAWWLSALKLLIHPLVPRPLLAACRRGRASPGFPQP